MALFNITHGVILIITNICRGLGNQMFRYAAGRALSLRYGCPLKLDTSWFSVFARNNNLFGACTARQYLLPIFNLPCEIATKEEIMDLYEKVSK